MPHAINRTEAKEVNLDKSIVITWHHYSSSSSSAIPRGRVRSIKMQHQKQSIKGNDPNQWVFIWLKRPIREPQTFLQCGHLLLVGQGSDWSSARLFLLSLFISAASDLLISSSIQPSWSTSEMRFSSRSNKFMKSNIMFHETSDWDQHFYLLMLNSFLVS